ncbi:hypothetical protein AOZ07_02885 [Glutamicibacter halophytocola]|uniref:hypothetical protein n=1 Tax=Glutamicibacter halophytocola TaxID=1933880 RepID=UPI0006D4AA77|nr:hypothetical protein [Glutamicibacter halophytocola]ALG28046.1 hypothetical protein AOZ07_02885 [Glutamicibacter halophytocola]
MIFIILCVILALVIVGFTLEDGVFGFVSSAFFGSIVAGLTFLLIWIIVGLFVQVPYQSETTHKLQAMGNSGGASGSFFLGTGYMSDKSVINYIEKLEGGGSQLKRVDASRSTIYEVDEDPTLITRHYSGSPWWLAPFDMYSAENFEFRVPNGTVTESFELSTE